MRQTPHLYGRVKQRLSGHQSCTDCSGPNKLLSDCKEEGLILWLKTLEKIGTRASKEMLENECNKILRRRHTDPNTPPPLCSEHWAYCFIKRHPPLKLRVQNPKEIDCEAVEDLEAIHA